MLPVFVDSTSQTYNAGLGIDLARQGVDADHMRGLVIPWAILSPVGRGDLVPGIFKVTS